MSSDGIFERIVLENKIPGIKLRFECPYCKCVSVKEGFFSKKDPFSQNEFVFRCEMCEIGWKITEFR